MKREFKMIVDTSKPNIGNIVEKMMKELEEIGVKEIDGKLVFDDFLIDDVKKIASKYGVRL